MVYIYSIYIVEAHSTIFTLTEWDHQIYLVSLNPAWWFRHLSIKRPLFQLTILHWNHNGTNFRTLGMALGMRLRPCLLIPAIGNTTRLSLSLSKLLLDSRSSLSLCALQTSRCVTLLRSLQLISCITGAKAFTSCQRNRSTCFHLEARWSI